MNGRKFVMIMVFKTFSDIILTLFSKDDVKAKKQHIEEGEKSATRKNKDNHEKLIKHLQTHAGIKDILFIANTIYLNLI